jgi:hypothetical protein
VIQPHDVSLCFTDPGFEVDAVLESPLAVLYQVWDGALDLATVRADGRVSLSGRRDVVVRLPQALRLSPVAPYVRRGLARAAAG